MAADWIESTKKDAGELDMKGAMHGVKRQVWSKNKKKTAAKDRAERDSETTARGMTGLV